MVEDYSYIDREENLPLKLDLKKLITLFEIENIKYWVDFATLEKIHNNRKSLYYLNAFDLCITEDDYDKVFNILKVNDFWLLNVKDCVLRIAPEGIELRDDGAGRGFVEKIYGKTTPTWDRILKWIYIWVYRYTDERKEFISLKLPKRDFIYNKEILFTTEKINYCDIDLNVPKYYDLIKKIRFKDHVGEVWCHGPKFRDNKETEWGFCNFRRDEL